MLDSIVIMDRNNDVLPCNLDKKAALNNGFKKASLAPSKPWSMPNTLMILLAFFDRKNLIYPHIVPQSPTIDANTS
jgi:hypothetical protein